MMMKAIVLAMVFGAAIFVKATSAAPTPVSGAGGKALVIEVTVAAPVSAVWQAFATEKGLTSWLAPSATVDLRPGGDWLVHFGPSTGGGTVVSFVPEKELVMSALAPDKFPAVRAARTRAVFTFTAHGDTTVVRLTQTGWQTGAEWDAAYEYLVAGNAQLMASLVHRFAIGPVDWTKS
jgi:uncharacterized protein YndB with AHSA1/START domain